MASRAETSAEFEALRAELSRAPEERLEPEPEADESLAALLKPYGVDGDALEELLARAQAELETLHSEKPLLTLAGAFGLGVLVGRATK